MQLRKYFQTGLLAAMGLCCSAIQSHGADQGEQAADDPYLPPFIWEFGDGVDLEGANVRRDRIFARFQFPKVVDDYIDGIYERSTVRIEVYNSPEDAHSNYSPTSRLSSGFRLPDPSASVVFDVGEQCSFRYTPTGVVVHFQRGPYYVLTSYHERNDEGPAVKQEREDFHARLKKLDEALQEWTLKDFEEMLKEHYPAHIPSVEAKKKEVEPHPWTKLSHDECLLFLKDPNVEGHDMAGFIYHLGKRDLGADTERFAKVLMELAENEQSHRSVKTRAVEALEGLAWKGSVPYLRGLIEAGPAFGPKVDHSRTVIDDQRRAYALDALVKIQGEEPLQPLLEQLAKDEGERERIRSKAASLLRRLERRRNGE